MIRYRVVFRTSARTDLRKIWNFIARDSPDTADRWIEILSKRAELLAEFPQKGRVYKDRYRIFTVDNGYRIYYRVDDSQKIVVIVHFFSPYQNQP